MITPRMVPVYMPDGEYIGEVNARVTSWDGIK